MKPTGKSAADALAESPLAGLLDQARKLGRVSSLVQSFYRDTAGGDSSLPPPRCAFQGRDLVITVTTPSVAAKLRQRAAALHQFLQECEPELTGIRIRLQPGQPQEPVAGSSPAGRPTQGRLAGERLPDTSAALRFAEKLSTELRDSALRRSAQRLQATLRARQKAGL